MRRIGAALALAVCVALFLWARAGQQATAPMLPVSFAHADHREVNCVTCHHNFVDTTGDGLCFGCHKHDPEIAPEIETMFHDLCRDCHVQRQRDGLEGGPTRACFGCHEGDELP